MDMPVIRTINSSGGNLVLIRPAAWASAMASILAWLAAMTAGGSAAVPPRGDAVDPGAGDAAVGELLRRRLEQPSLGVLRVSCHASHTNQLVDSPAPDWFSGLSNQPVS